MDKVCSQKKNGTVKLHIFIEALNPPIVLVSLLFSLTIHFMCIQQVIYKKSLHDCMSLLQSLVATVSQIHRQIYDHNLKGKR